MEIDCPHILAVCKINFTIPEGYTVKNLDDLKMDIVYQDKGSNDDGFTAGYVVEGNGESNDPGKIPPDQLSAGTVRRF